MARKVVTSRRLGFIISSPEGEERLSGWLEPAVLR